MSTPFIIRKNPFYIKNQKAQAAEAEKLLAL
jgi:hypothetical protein